MTDVCSIEGCGRPMLKKCGLCSPHYQRKQRHGDPLGGGPIRKPLPAVCKIEGCDKRTTGSEMCSMHYARNRKHGSPHAGALVPKATCSIEGCGKPNASHFLCDAHLARFRRHGDVGHGGDVMARATSGEPLKWLLAHVDHISETCLIWPFGRDTTGYGGLLFEGKDDRAHRVMCRLVNGEPPSEEQDIAAHSCGNGHLGCVNPKHVRWATYKENADDKVLHGTQRSGSAIHLAKLDERRVRAIRNMALSAKEAAPLFGVTVSTINHIRARKSWKHI